MTRRFLRDAPEVEFMETVYAHGHLISGEERVRLPRITLQRPEYAYSDTWNLAAVVMREDAKTASGFLYERRSQGIRLEGYTERETPLTINEVHIPNLVQGEVKGDVDQFFVGPLSLPAVPNHQSITLDLTPTSVATAPPTERTVSDGKVLTFGQEPFRWRSSVGVFRMQVVQQKYRHVRSGGTAGSVEFGEVVMLGAVDEAARTASPKDLIQKVAEEVSAFLYVLSLLSRGRVSCHAIHVYSGNTHDHQSTTWRKGALYSHPPDWVPPLVLAKDLKADDIEMMASTLSQHPGRAQLSVAIPFLLDSFADRGLEAKVISAFTALEATVSGLPSADDPDGSDIVRLRAELTKCLKDFRPEPPISESALKRAEARIKSLPSRPLSGRVAELVERHKVQWSDLWPPDTDLEAGLAASLRLRNTLLHQGLIVTPASGVYPEAIRIQMLTERLLFAALGGRPEWLFKGAYGHVDMVSRYLWESSEG